MSKRKRHAQQPATIDLGPSVRRARGDVVVSYRPDPEQPSRTVQGARVRVWYHHEWIDGRMTDAQHEAADRYSLWSEEAEALAEGKPFAMRGGGGAFNGPGDRLVWLRAQLRDADDTLAHDRDAVRSAVFENMEPRTSADRKRVLDGLHRLAEFWEM